MLELLRGTEPLPALLQCQLPVVTTRVSTHPARTRCPGGSQLPDPPSLVTTYAAIIRTDAAFYSFEVMPAIRSTT
jgi:hypothetical protein